LSVLFGSPSRTNRSTLPLKKGSDSTISAFALAFGNVSNNSSHSASVEALKTTKSCPSRVADHIGALDGFIALEYAPKEWMFFRVWPGCRVHWLHQKLALGDDRCQRMQELRPGLAGT